MTRSIVSLARGQMAVLPLNGTADQNTSSDGTVSGAADGQMAALPLNSAAGRKTRVTYYCSRSSPIGRRTIEDWKDAKPVLVPNGGCVKLEEGKAMFLVIQIPPKGGEEGAAAAMPQISPS